jgi:hypothetical protein
MARKKAAAPSAEDLRKQAMELASTPLVAVGTEESAAEDDPKDAIDYTFQFGHKDRRGTSWAGAFTNRILNVGEQQAVSSIAARMAGGVPFEAMDPLSQTLNQAIAHMSVSLTTEDGDWRCPEWARDLRQLHDQNIIVALWQEVVTHERRFFRLDSNPEEGAKTT